MDDPDSEAQAAAKSLEKSFHMHFQRASGSAMHRNAVAVAMTELEDPWVSQVTAQFSPTEQPIFLIAYQCFILWVVTHVLRGRLQHAELEDIARGVRVAFASLPTHNQAIFEKIWPFTQQFMPIALKGGKQTGVVYPLPIIIQAATSAGYPLPQKITDYRLGLHPLAAMNTIASTLSWNDKQETN